MPTQLPILYFHQRVAGCQHERQHRKRGQSSRTTVEAYMQRITDCSLSGWPSSDVSPSTASSKVGQTTTQMPRICMRWLYSMAYLLFRWSRVCRAGDGIDYVGCPIFDRRRSPDDRASRDTSRPTT